MSLLRRLETLRRLEVPALPGLNHLRSAVERVRAHWPDIVATPPDADRERLVAEMSRRLREDQWEGATMRLATSAARALFDPERRTRTDLALLRDFYCAEIRASLNPTFLGALFSVYLDSYAPDAPHTRALAAALKSAKGSLGAHAGLIAGLPDLLDPVRAPEIVSARMLTMGDPWTELKELGLRAPHAPGLMDHAHLAYVRKLAPGLARRAERDRLFAWLRPEGQAARISGASEAISALLAPWRNAEPAEEEMSHLTQALVSFYGDPRVNPGGVWGSIATDLRDIIFRWLTGENILFFLDIVSKVESSHMWEPRRKFWLDLHEQKRIDAAWVAFSSSGAALAQREGYRDGRTGTLKFGRQTAGGTRSGTSLLILRIGDKIIVEGSHNYRVHIFSSNHRAAPKLYQDAYDCEAIRLLPGSEARAHQSGWQGWVEERI